MRSVAVFQGKFIVLCLVTACTPNFATLQQSTADRWESELRLEYQMVFEKRLYLDREGMNALITKTSAALQDSSIADRNLVTAQQHLSKLKTYLSYAEIAEVIEDTTLIKKNLAALILDKLRQTPVTIVDTTADRDAFHRQAMAGEFTATGSTDQAKREFMRALLREVIAMTENTLRTQQYLFPFLADDFDASCRETHGRDCAKLLSTGQAQNSLHAPFNDIGQVTERVNAAISKFNKIINLLNILQPTKKGVLFQETDFERYEAIILYQFYEMAIIDAMRDGVLPILFSDIFRQRGGSIWLKQNGTGEIINDLLTTLTATTVATALREMQHNLLTSLQQLRKMQKDDKLPRDKKIYQWAVSNEVGTARVIAKNPAHTLVVAELLHQYQDEARSPMLAFLEGVISYVEFGAILAIPVAFGINLIPGLRAINLMRHVALVGTAANFPWIGLTQAKHIIARNRYLMLERALLRGSSERVSYSLKLLKEKQRKRKYAVISGTLGLTMSVPAMKYVWQHTNAGFRNNVIDMISSLASDYDGFTKLMYEDRIEMSESELEFKPGH